MIQRRFPATSEVLHAEHRLRNFAGAADVEHGLVTTGFIESVFGCADSAMTTGGGGGCVSQVGSTLGGMNGIFQSRRQQLAQCVKVRFASRFLPFVDFIVPL